MVGPGAGVAVGLQLEPDGAAVGPVSPGVTCAFGAEQVLHVVAVLVRDDVGVDEQPALRPELLLELVEEAEVDVDQLVGGAVEGPGAAGGGPQLVCTEPEKKTVSVGT